MEMMDCVWIELVLLAFLIIAAIAFSSFAGFCDVPEDQCRLTKWLKEREQDHD